MTDNIVSSPQDSSSKQPSQEQVVSNSNGMKRSKTVRNLNSASNKMKGLFKTKEKAKKGERRPSIASSISLGPGDHNNPIGKIELKIFFLLYIQIAFPWGKTSLCRKRKNATNNH